MNDIPRTDVSEEIELRELAIADLPKITLVHLQAFPGSALSSLGTGAVSRYYEWQMLGPHQCISLGAWQGGEFCGFSFGGRFNGALSGFLERNKGYLLAKVISRPWLATHPWFRDRMRTALKSLLRSFKECRKSKDFCSESRNRNPSKSFGILSIAVAPSAKRKGIGSKLMQGCEQVAREWGAEQMHLTVSVDNQEAVCFYEKLGWQRDVQPKHWKGCMIKTLS